MSDSAAENLSGVGESSIPCRPFLKWAGGKGQLLGALLERIPEFSGVYYEPFLGGGALLLALQPARAVVTDINAELVNCFLMVRDHVEDLIAALLVHRFDESYYYAVRDADRATDFFSLTPLQRASRFIFLNKTCFNGLYRVNAKGHFNVPIGDYRNPRILDADNLRACSRALQGVDVRQGPFLAIEGLVTSADFVYFDPPYVPLTQTSSFTGYAKGGFGPKEQQELFELCCRLDARGVRFMLSNSSAPEVLELYKSFRVETIDAVRSINSKGAKRGAVAEVIVRNF